MRPATCGALACAAPPPGYQRPKVLPDLDRWYHRAAVIVWPGDQAFANRAETSPAWALDELAAMASAGDVPPPDTPANNTTTR